MEKKLAGLRWACMRTSHIGCMKGYVDWLAARGKLEKDISTAWLMGATGHAFIINVHDEVVPSGPTAWHTESVFRLARNTGAYVDGLFTNTHAPDVTA